jgi:Zn-dependent protease with chaperone function
MVSHIHKPWQVVLAEGKQAFASGDFSSGQDLFTTALSLAHEESAAEADIGQVFFAFGSCLVASGETAAGRQRLNQALRTFERSLGADSPMASMVRDQLAALDPGEHPPSQAQVAPPAGALTEPPAEELFEAPAPTPAVTSAASPVRHPVSTEQVSQAPQPIEPSAGPGGLPRFIKTSARGSDPSYDQIMAARPPKAVGPIFVEDFIHPREKLYGFCTAAISIWLYCILTLCLVAIAIAPLALLAGFISAGIHLGHLRSRGIKVTDRQFPEVFNLIDQYSTALNMQPPEVYVVQEHGLLNAFANRLHRKDVIVIYSDVLELAYAMGEKEMAFVVCHELAHIKRGHVRWAWLHIPGEAVPFLGTAYSRACEYTCDRVAAEIVPDGALFGLVCLAAGTKLYKRVNIKALYEQAEEEWGFWTWFTEIQSTHPNLMNRIRAIGLRDQAIKGFKTAAAAKAG